MCGDGVLEDERYKTFMDDFGSEVHVCIQIICPKRYVTDYMQSTSLLRASIFRIR